MKKRRFKLPFKLIGLIFLILLAFIIIIGYIWLNFRTSDYFKVKEVMTRGPSALNLAYLKGKNIFSIDLKKESQYILEYCPSCSRVRLVRILPNRLFVDFIKRKAIALVKLYRYFSLDENGIIFYAPEDSAELGLPVVTGLETKLFGPKPGKKYNIKEITLSLNIIKEARKNNILRDYKIKKIDVANPENATIIVSFMPRQPGYMKTAAQAPVEGLLEIKTGEDNIKDKFIVLSNIFSQGKFDLSNIKYIDLRFKEPVIKFKETNAK